MSTSSATSTAVGIPKKRAILSLGPVTKKLEQTQLDTQQQPPPLQQTNDNESTTQPTTTTPPPTTIATPSSTSSMTSTLSTPLDTTLSHTSATTHSSTTALTAPSDLATTATSSAAASAATASASSTSTPSQPPKKGLTLDPVRQAMIDAAYAPHNLGLPRPPDPSRVLECYDVSSDMTAAYIQQSCGPHALTTHFVDDEHVLVIFDTAQHAREMLKQNATRLKLRAMDDASEAARAQLPHIIVPTTASSSTQRPQTDSRAANRLLAGALGLRMPKQSPEERAAELKKKEERRKQLEQERAKTQPSAAGDGWD